MFFLDYATTVILEYSLTWGVESKTWGASDGIVTTRLQALFASNVLLLYNISSSRAIVVELK